MIMIYFFLSRKRKKCRGALLSAPALGGIIILPGENDLCGNSRIDLFRLSLITGYSIYLTT